MRPDRQGQRLRLPSGDEVHGLFTVPVDHAGNARESAEEAEAVVDLFRRLLADEFSRRGKLGKEANTRMVATSYMDVIDSLIGG